MKRILFIVALLPFLVKAQSINNQKVRWMQPIYMGSNTAATVNASSDTGAFFFDRADSVLYFKYKGAARAIGYAGSIPNVGQQITDSLKALVRLRASGSGGIQLQNSVGTNVADFGIANTTNGSIAGGWNIGGNLAVTGTSGFTGKATFTDSIVGVNQRLSGNLITSNIAIGGTSADGKMHITNNEDKANLILDNYVSGWGFLRLAYQGVDYGYIGQGNGLFTGAATSDIGLRGENNVLFGIGSTEAARFNSNRRLLINTTTDNGQLVQINGTTDIRGALTATAQGNNIVYTVDSTTISTSNYTLVAGDASKRFYIKNSSTAITVTIPADASVNFPVGTEIIFFQDGTGDITISGASGVTLKSGSGLTKLGEQYAFAGVVKLSANTWGFTGNRK